MAHAQVSTQAHPPKREASSAEPLLQETARTAIKNLRELKDQEEAKAFLPKVVSMIDRLAKKGNIHRNKASNLKSGLMRHVNAMAS
jgi:small subunit ribosomal protein S20